MSASSLIGHLGSSAFRLSDYPPLQCRCRSRARASLRNRHQGPSIMGFEDEAEQSFSRPCRQSNGRSKRTCELTSSIVPRGRSFHCSVDFEFPPIVLILCAPHAAAVSLVQRNSVPSTQMRCRIRLARYLLFPHDPARIIHNADAGLLDRYVQSSKMVHAALLLLMLEAVTTDLVFTISLKRSTQNLQLSTSWAGRLPHLLEAKRTSKLRTSRSESDPIRTFRR